MDALRLELSRHFGFLELAGFVLRIEDFSPQHFGNFVATYASADLSIRLTRDRGQVFVDLSAGNESWQDKEVLLEKLAVPRTRHPTVSGLWSGYEISIQALELQQYLPKLKEAVRESAA